MLRSRLVSLLLLLASPAVGGTVLPVAHPCPVDAPWLAAGSHGATHGHSGHHDQSHTPTNRSGHTCTCPGTCAAGISITVPTAVDGRYIPESPLRLFRAARSQRVAWSQSQLDLLPPSTAPPIV